MIEVTRRNTRRFLWRFATAAGVVLGFFWRYLSAPLALDKPPDDKKVEDMQTSTQMNTRKQASGSENGISQAARSGRLLARPAQVNQTARRGVLRLGLGKLRDGLIYVPAGYQASRPAPLVLSLHGAGGNANQGLRLLQQHADRSGFILLAVESRGSTWDMLLYGASYALSLGLTNGDLFKRVIAFSPGFMAPAEQRGKSPIFISHGKSDKVLPIDKCSRRIVPQLQRAGYAVRYREFDGSHILPDEISQEAVGWWLRHPKTATG
jgi:phospholipase/carboxylesterase